MGKIKNGIAGAAIAAGGFGAGHATSTTIMVKPPLGHANYKEYTQQVCEELKDRTWFVKCQQDELEFIDDN